MHIGSTVGLCPPATNLDDGGKYTASQDQRDLWRNWLDFWTFAVQNTAGRRVLVLNGDILEKDAKRRSHQIITRNEASLLQVAATVLKPALEWAESIYVVRGTEAHSGKSAHMEEALAYDIGAVQDKANNTYSYWHLRMVASGVRFDIAHHASMGGLPWTEKTAAIKLAEIILRRYAEMRMPLPDVAVRGHTHRYADSGWNYDPMLVVIAPAWTAKTAYVYGVGKENDQTLNGGLLFWCEDGRMTWDRKFYKPKVSRWETD